MQRSSASSIDWSARWPCGNRVDHKIKSPPLPSIWSVLRSFRPGLKKSKSSRCACSSKTRFPSSDKHQANTEIHRRRAQHRSAKRCLERPRASGSSIGGAGESHRRLSVAPIPMAGQTRKKQQRLISTTSTCAYPVFQLKYLMEFRVLSDIPKRLGVMQGDHAVILDRSAIPRRAAPANVGADKCCDVERGLSGEGCGRITSRMTM